MNQPPPVVVDTSVVVKWFFEEPHASGAVALLRTWGQGKVRLLAPDLIYAEFANTVWKRVREGMLMPGDGTATIETFLALPVEITPSQAILEPAYRLAVQYRQTVYDALFLALGQDAGAPVVTADEQLYHAVRPEISFVRWIGDWSGTQPVPAPDDPV